jgi:hypothetical protein
MKVWVDSFLGFVRNKDPIVSGCFTCGKLNRFRAFRDVRFLRELGGHLALDKAFDSGRSEYSFATL